jgi:hypothetical protein
MTNDEIVKRTVFSIERREVFVITEEQLTTLVKAVLDLPEPVVAHISGFGGDTSVDLPNVLSTEWNGDPAILADFKEGRIRTYQVRKAVAFLVFKGVLVNGGNYLITIEGAL